MRTVADVEGQGERRWHLQDITNARPIPPRGRQRLDRDPIPVRARLVWEKDGEQMLDTFARDWVGRDVLVDVRDDRWRTLGVWLDADDVTRR